MNGRSGQVWTSSEREKTWCQEEKSSGANAIDGILKNNFGVRKEEATIDSKDFRFGFLFKPRGFVVKKEVPVVQPNTVEVLDTTVRNPRRFWTTEEHRQFLRGLSKYGRGYWKMISKEFVPTRTSIQVSSHAQKYYKRLERKKAGNQLRYSINDLEDEVTNPQQLVPKNTTTTNTWQPLDFTGSTRTTKIWQPLNFTGGGRGGYRAPAMQAPAPAPVIPFSNMNATNVARFRSSFTTPASQQQPTWSGVQMSANSVTSPMAGPRRFMPAREEGSSNMYNMY